MPSFNSSRHISEAIRSVLDQTLRDVELIVVDGGSRDDTLRVVSLLAASDRRVVLIQNQNDQGPAHARSVGVAASKGSYVAFLDADDYWLPEKLEAQLAFMQGRSVQFCYARYRAVSEDGRTTGCLVPMRRTYSYSDALSHRGIGTLTVMVDKALLTPDVTNTWRRAGGEEYLWWLLVLRKNVVAHLLDLDLARYRNTGGSLSKNQLYTLRTVWSFYRKELALSCFSAAAHYVSYVCDSAWRKARLATCGRLRKAFVPKGADELGTTAK